jgi:hypothetical protein
MGDPRIVFGSCEVYPFDWAGPGKHVTLTAGSPAPVLPRIRAGLREDHTA